MADSHAADEPSDPAVRTFHIPLDASGTSLLPVRIVEPARVQSDNLPLSTWASSLILARALHKLGLERCLEGDDADDDISSQHTPRSPSPVAPLPILELGAGTGLVGVTAAALLRARAACLTDLAGIVPGVAANIAANAATLARRGVERGSVRAGVLDWRSPRRIEYAKEKEEDDNNNGSTMTRRSTLPSSVKARILLAADTVYDEMHPELLERVAREWLERSARARFVICYALRVAYLDQVRELWERFEAAGLEAEIEGRDTGEETNGDDELLCEYVVWKWKDI